MKKKIIGIFIMIMLVLTMCFIPNLNALRINQNNYSTSIEFFIELEDLPETLIFDKDYVTDYEEYSWNIFVDVDDDINTGTPYESLKGMDLIIKINYIKQQGGSPRESTIIAECEFSTIFWGEDGYFNKEHDIYNRVVYTEADLIVLYCPTSWSEIQDVDSSDRVIIRASSYNENGERQDDITSTERGIVTDPAGDIIFPYVDIIAGGISSPTTPVITGETSGKAGETQTYSFLSYDIVQQNLYYYIDWGDGNIDEWVGPFTSGEEIERTHTFEEEGDYIIKAKVKNTKNVESDWGQLEVSMPKQKTYNQIDQIILRLIQRFQILEFLI